MQPHAAEGKEPFLTCAESIRCFTRSRLTSMHPGWAAGRHFTWACMTHSRQQQQRGSRVGPVQQGLAGSGCHATCPGDPGTTPASITIS
eukprot:1146305-Pelagomonas_calceolata.AAC.6